KVKKLHYGCSVRRGARERRSSEGCRGMGIVTHGVEAGVGVVVAVAAEVGGGGGWVGQVSEKETFSDCMSLGERIWTQACALTVLRMSSVYCTPWVCGPLVSKVDSRIAGRSNWKPSVEELASSW